MFIPQVSMWTVATTENLGDTDDNFFAVNFETVFYILILRFVISHKISAHFSAA